MASEQQFKHVIILLLIGMLVSSVLLFFAGKVTMRMFSKVSHIPQTLLTPLVLLLCIFGIYSIASSTFDVAVEWNGNCVLQISCPDPEKAPVLRWKGVHAIVGSSSCKIADRTTLHLQRCGTRTR